jgi:hypothetical protein
MLLSKNKTSCQAQLLDVWTSTNALMRHAAAGARAGRPLNESRGRAALFFYIKICGSAAR